MGGRRGFRAIGKLIPLLLTVVAWAGGLFMALTGLLLWREWHALVERGLPLEARIVECRHESLFRSRVSGPSSSGYYSCTYTFAGGPGDFRSGYFQSQRPWEAGEAVPIRYLPNEPRVSAAEESLRHPSVVPAALVVLPGLFLGHQVWRRRRARRS